MDWKSDPEAAADADAIWECVKKGDVATCCYHRDGHCVLSGRPCADAVKDAREKIGLESKRCLWAPPED